ncbi:chemotaxis response regulator protein-glutamate methylesterase [Cellulomonas cellasea]|uniref:protein-glutamate methylesterase/protein-glutamine glutaminase n=1 Tax=Cellulomonas cellasea TaxID=43670 RepID=UPI0025A408CD|nr:chemotaxis response regulator protein-glutamate methylesterase [Cellulomonas cellasea]MDM8083365.1 chemotaxis response regulator protein-glutamate methylesterase [Cellulomonas cellasea]
MTRIRVLVVDDSVVIRRLVTEALSTDASVEVVGTASNGRLALAKAAQLGPDLITMDVEMPEMNGIEAVRELRRTGHRMPIVMFSTLTEKGAAATLDALVAGASDYVTKPSGSGSVQESLQRVAGQLLPKIHALVGPGFELPGRVERAAPPAPGLTRPPARPEGADPAPGRPEPSRHPVRAVVMGSSTGGPEALSRVLGSLSQPLPVPVLVVQHMPPVFTRQLAARLDRIGPSTVVECHGDEDVLPGHVYVAPGNHHLELRRVGSGLRTALTQAPPVNFCRPAVDVLFRSAVQVLRGDLLGVVLTGMGADGRTGCEDVVTAGGTVVVQDKASSVVWGMPGVVAAAGLAHRIVPLDEMAQVIESTVQRAATRPAGLRGLAVSQGGAS